MDYRLLGNSGTSVSTLTLGTMTFGSEADEPTSHQILDTFVAAGGTLVDTRGRVLRQRVRAHHRPLARPPTPPRRSRSSSRRRAGSRRATAERPRTVPPAPPGRARRVAGTARRRAHRPLPDARVGRPDPDRGDPALPRRRRLRGQDRQLRFSNYLGYQVTKAVYEAKAHGWAPPVTLQPQYNLLVRDIEHEVVPACLDAGIVCCPGRPSPWLAVREVPARRGPDRRDAAR